LAVLALTMAITVPARAQVARTFTPRFNAQTTGDVTLIGNTMMTCTAGGQCASAQAGGGGGNNNNQNFTMQYVDEDGDASTLSASGFLMPPSGTVQAGVGIVAYDGDAGHTGEDLILNSTTLGDALNPVNNVFNSTLSLEGTRFSAKNPDYVNQLGFDADILAANGVLGNGTTSATVTLQSASDRYYAG